MAVMAMTHRKTLSPFSEQRDASLRPEYLSNALPLRICLRYGKNPLATTGMCFTVPLGSVRGFTEVLVIMIPLMFCALAVAIPHASAW